MSARTAEIIDMRVRMIAGPHALFDNTTERFICTVQVATHKLARLLSDERPANVDIGRFLAALDRLKEASVLFMDAAVMGANEAAKTSGSANNE